ncbi:MAG: hypothetical protein LQ346_006135 [Caloplaca aetnensis]|nr:MAG: hypothetical protein LQ346_006135 [Caloplaca aetnensis]
MVREELISSANLTQEEIDVALAQAGDTTTQAPPPPPPPPQSRGYPSQQVARQANGYGYGYGPYPSGPWAQPVEPPRRDWRDYFIIATLTSTLGYTLYTLSRRYITPLISPPTPPQIESDKASIDASFARAFALIDQLASDTTEMKAREQERTEKLDKALREINAVVEELRKVKKREEMDSDMLKWEVQSLHDLVPKALEGWKKSGDKRLEELGTEVRSVKKLLGTRLGNAGPSSSPNLHAPPTLSPKQSSAFVRTASNPPPPTFDIEREKSEERRGSSTADAAGLEGKVAAGKASYEGSERGDKMAPAPGVNVPKREGSGSQGFGRGGRPSIPAWQMATPTEGKGEGSSDAGAGT